MRPAYWEIQLPGRDQCRRDERGRMLPNDDLIVLGRKFCAGCGHWRHVCDFGYLNKRGLRARCRVCWNREAQQRRRAATPEQRERWREYWRFHQEAQRRRNGIPERNFHNRRSVIDRIERILLPTAPLVKLLEPYRDDELLGELSRRAGVPERSITRLLSGESAQVRIDLADKIAVALGMPSALIYGDLW